MKRPGEAPEPSIEVDVDRKYIVELNEMTEGPSQWDDAKEGDMSLTWKFRMFELSTGEVVIDNNNGFAYELWQFSNDKTYRNISTGKVAKAREWADALVGRELSDDDIDRMIDEGFGESLKGKRGLADVEWYINKKGYERLKIIRLRPLSKKRPTAAVPLDEPEAVQAALERDEAETLDRRARPVPVESKAERQARLRRELEESETDAA